MTRGQSGDGKQHNGRDDHEGERQRKEGSTGKEKEHGGGERVTAGMDARERPGRRRLLPLDGSGPTLTMRPDLSTKMASRPRPALCKESPWAAP